MIRTVLRKTGRGGTALPGIVAMKVAKNILAVPASEMDIVVVTGTNGKTTTCNMIEHALSENGHDCHRDKSGANLLHGIASDLVCDTNWLGKPRNRYAVLEVDEAALKQVVPYIRPKVIVVTNLFTDQADRFGSVENTLAEIRKGVKRSPGSVLVLNAEDTQSASLALDVPNKVVWYGLDKTVGTQGNVDLSDAGKCPKCGGEYTYDYHIYADLGGFRCPECGHKRQDPDVAVTSITQKTSDGSVVRMRPGKKAAEQDVRIALPAVYNIYNAAASVAAILALKLPAREAVDALSSARASFGRLETFELNGNRLQMILVKNPAGCNQAFSYITGLGEDFSAVLCLNNRTGDGHDISWIETTDYEKLVSDPHLKKIYAGGDCAEELCSRLKKAGADDRILESFTDYSTLVEKLKTEPNPVFLLPNYTSMMELRDALSPETGAKDFWE
jgi:UDP-N-acetylmuramyl tripeptide synthase